MPTNQPPQPVLATDPLVADLKTQLTAGLAQATGQSLAQVESFAVQMTPQLVAYAQRKAAALVANDQAASERANQDLADIQAQATLTICRQLVNLEQTAESKIAAAISTIATAAVTKLAALAVVA